MRRRSLLLGLALVGAVLMFSGTPAGAAEQTVHIGYQKASAGLILAKESGALEQRLKTLGFALTWHEFASGPPMLEALNVGSIALAMTGDTPPIFAQAAGAHLVYAGYEPAKPDSSAILVLKDSPLSSVSDLKGKKIAFDKGSSAHNLVLTTLEKAGLGIKDITAIYLAPAEAQAAFQTKAVDAWAIWDPFYAQVESTTPVRALTTGRGLVPNYTFYLAADDFARRHPEVLTAVFDELAKNQAWRERAPDEVSALLARWAGIDKKVFDVVMARRPDLTVRPVPAEVIAEQQAIADIFYKNGILPKPIAVSEAAWKGN